MTTTEMLAKNQADIDFVEAQLARGIDRNRNRATLAELESDRDELIAYRECELASGDPIDWQDAE